MKSILLPTYFPSILFWKIILKNDFFWMKKSYYKKQTLRNRMFIHGANGKLMLSTPILHSGCLLYTSPSPRDVEESRMPSSA